MPVTIPNAVRISISFIPILWLAFSLGILKLRAHAAGPLGLALAAGCSFLLGFPFQGILESAAEGAILALIPILWAIFGAVFTYELGVETGYMSSISGMLRGVTSDRRIQVLILAWAFSGFLEGAAGYGTAVAIPVSILIALGTDPFTAAVVALIGNTAPTAFGAIGIPTTTLANLTGFPVAALSGDISLQLSPLIVMTPFVLLAGSGEPHPFRGTIPAAIASGVVFAAVSWFSAAYLGPELPALLGGIVTLGVLVPAAKRSPGAGRDVIPSVSRSARTDGRRLLTAWSPYIVLFALIVLSSSVVPPVHAAFASVSSRIRIFSGPGAAPMEIKWLLTPGTLLFVSAAVGGLLQGATVRTFARVFVSVIRKLFPSMVTVVSIVALARIMTNGGMAGILAGAVAGFSGRIYPLFAPAVGALGTFLTGSDTSSNVLFASFQKETALGIGVSPRWISASNTAGAALGKMISPQNIAIAAGAAGLAGREGDLLRRVLPICLAGVLLLGGLVFAGALILPPG